MIFIKRYIFVFLFGIIGGGGRYLLEKYITFNDGFPIATLLINLVGCFLFAIVIQYIPRKFSISSNLASGLSAGLIGSFTTFSSFNLDAVKLLMHGHTFMFVIYFVITIAGGLIAILLGNKFSRYLLRKNEVWS